MLNPIFKNREKIMITCHTDQFGYKKGTFYFRKGIEYLMIPLSSSDQCFIFDDKGHPHNFSICDLSNDNNYTEHFIDPIIMERDKTIDDILN